MSQTDDFQYLHHIQTELENLSTSKTTKNKRGYYQSYYEPKNPEKYIGKKLPFCRSSWEKKFCILCDTRDSILEWASEPFSFNYPWFNDQGKPTIKLYIPDFYVKVKRNDGVIEKLVVEIKPKDQANPPKEPAKKTDKAMRTYKAKLLVYKKNEMKWKHAVEICKKSGFRFVIFTEDDIF